MHHRPMGPEMEFTKVISKKSKTFGCWPRCRIVGRKKAVIMQGFDFVFILNSIIEIFYIRCKTNKNPDENPDPSMYF